MTLGDWLHTEMVYLQKTVTPPSTNPTVNGRELQLATCWMLQWYIEGNCCFTSDTEERWLVTGMVQAVGRSG